MRPQLKIPLQQHFILMQTMIELELSEQGMSYTTWKFLLRNTSYDTKYMIYMNVCMYVFAGSWKYIKFDLKLRYYDCRAKYV